MTFPGAELRRLKNVVYKSMSKYREGRWLKTFGTERGDTGWLFYELKIKWLFDYKTKYVNNYYFTPNQCKEKPNHYVNEIGF